MTQGYWVILRTEIFSLFISPATYVSTFYFLALLGVGFRFFIESFTGTNWILPPLSSLALGLLFGAPALIPFLTMRTIAEERRLGTLETLMTAPVNAVSIIAGKWRSNVIRMIEEANIHQIVIMMTVTGLSLMSITEFMDDMMSIKRKYGKNMPTLDLNFLRWPAFMSPLNLPDEVKMEAREKIQKWLDKNRDSGLLLEHEITQTQRVIDYIEVVDQGHARAEMDKEKHFHDFKSFYVQYDKRRNKDFKKTFPMLAEWYDSIVVDETIPDVELTKGGMEGWEIGEYKPDILKKAKQNAGNWTKII